MTTKNYYKTPLKIRPRSDLSNDGLSNLLNFKKFFDTPDEEFNNAGSRLTEQSYPSFDYDIANEEQKAKTNALLAKEGYIDNKELTKRNQEKRDSWNSEENENDLDKNYSKGRQALLALKQAKGSNAGITGQDIPNISFGESLRGFTVGLTSGLGEMFTGVGNLAGRYNSARIQRLMNKAQNEKRPYNEVEEEDWVNSGNAETFKNAYDALYNWKLDTNTPTYTQALQKGMDNYLTESNYITEQEKQNGTNIHNIYDRAGLAIRNTLGGKVNFTEASAGLAELMAGGLGVSSVGKAATKSLLKASKNIAEKREANAVRDKVLQDISEIETKKIDEANAALVEAAKRKDFTYELYQQPSVQAFMKKGQVEAASKQARENLDKIYQNRLKEIKQQNNNLELSKFSKGVINTTSIGALGAGGDASGVYHQANILVDSISTEDLVNSEFGKKFMPELMAKNGNNYIAAVLDLRERAKLFIGNDSQLQSAIGGAIFNTLGITPFNFLKKAVGTQGAGSVIKGNLENMVVNGSENLNTLWAAQSAVEKAGGELTGGQLWQSAAEGAAGTVPLMPFGAVGIPISKGAKAIQNYNDIARQKEIERQKEKEIKKQAQREAELQQIKQMADEGKFSPEEIQGLVSSGDLPEEYLNKIQQQRQESFTNNLTEQNQQQQPKTQSKEQTSKYLAMVPEITDPENYEIVGYEYLSPKMQKQADALKKSKNAEKLRELQASIYRVLDSQKAKQAVKQSIANEATQQQQSASNITESPLNGTDPNAAQQQAPNELAQQIGITNTSLKENNNVVPEQLQSTASTSTNMENSITAPNRFAARQKTQEDINHEIKVAAQTMQALIGNDEYEFNIDSAHLDNALIHFDEASKALGMSEKTSNAMHSYLQSMALAKENETDSIVSSLKEYIDHGTGSQKVNNVLSESVLNSSSDSGKKSMFAHTREIFDAAKKGGFSTSNKELVSAIKDFVSFVQGQNNKRAATNAALNGNQRSADNPKKFRIGTHRQYNPETKTFYDAAGAEYGKNAIKSTDANVDILNAGLILLNDKLNMLSGSKDDINPAIQAALMEIEKSGERVIFDDKFFNRDLKKYLRTLKTKITNLKKSVELKNNKQQKNSSKSNQDAENLSNESTQQSKQSNENQEIETQDTNTQQQSDKPATGSGYVEREEQAQGQDPYSFNPYATKTNESEQSVNNSRTQELNPQTNEAQQTSEKDNTNRNEANSNESIKNVSTPEAINNTIKINNEQSNNANSPQNNETISHQEQSQLTEQTAEQVNNQQNTSNKQENTKTSSIETNEVLQNSAPINTNEQISGKEQSTIENNQQQEQVEATQVNKKTQNQPVETVNNVSVQEQQKAQIKEQQVINKSKQDSTPTEQNKTEEQSTTDLLNSTAKEFVNKEQQINDQIQKKIYHVTTAKDVKAKDQAELEVKANKSEEQIKEDAETAANGNKFVNDTYASTIKEEAKAFNGIRRAFHDLSEKGAKRINEFTSLVINSMKELFAEGGGSKRWNVGTRTIRRTLFRYNDNTGLGRIIDNFFYDGQVLTKENKSEIIHRLIEEDPNDASWATNISKLEEEYKKLLTEVFNDSEDIQNGTHMAEGTNIFRDNKIMVVNPSKSRNFVMFAQCDQNGKLIPLENLPFIMAISASMLMRELHTMSKPLDTSNITNDELAKIKANPEQEQLLRHCLDYNSACRMATNIILENAGISNGGFIQAQYASTSLGHLLLTQLINDGKVNLTLTKGLDNLDSYNAMTTLEELITNPDENADAYVTTSYVAVANKLENGKFVPTRETMSANAAKLLKRSNSDTSTTKGVYWDRNDADSAKEIKANIPVAERVNNSLIKTTTEQKHMIEDAQNVKHFINKKVYNLLKSVNFNRDKALELVKSMMGIDLQTEKVVTHDADGKAHEEERYIGNDKEIEAKLSRINAIERALDLYFEILSGFAESGKSLDDFNVRFEYGITSVNRLQPVNSSSPMMSKVTREFLSNAKAKIDTEDPTTKQFFYNAIAQALGEHLEKSSPEKIAKFSQGIINDVEAWMKENPMPKEGDLTGWYSKLFKKFNQGENTIVSATALMEVADFISQGKPKEFETYLYQEFDGVTCGQWTAQTQYRCQMDISTLAALARVGMPLGTTMTVNDLYTYPYDLHQQYGESKQIDTYANFARHLTEAERNNILNLRRQMLEVFDSSAYFKGKGDEWRQEQIDGIGQLFEGVNNVLEALSLAIGTRLNANELTSYEINRSAVKKSVMAVLYGGGAKTAVEREVLPVEEKVGQILDDMTIALDQWLKDTANKKDATLTIDQLFERLPNENSANTKKFLDVLMQATKYRSKWQYEKQKAEGQPTKGFRGVERTNIEDHGPFYISNRNGMQKNNGIVTLDRETGMPETDDFNPAPNRYEPPSEENLGKLSKSYTADEVKPVIEKVLTTDLSDLDHDEKVLIGRALNRKPSEFKGIHQKLWGGIDLEPTEREHLYAYLKAHEQTGHMDVYTSTKGFVKDEDKEAFNTAYTALLQQGKDKLYNSQEIDRDDVNKYFNNASAKRKKAEGIYKNKKDVNKSKDKNYKKSNYSKQNTGKYDGDVFRFYLNGVEVGIPRDQSSGKSKKQKKDKSYKKYRKDDEILSAIENGDRLSKNDKYKVYYAIKDFIYKIPGKTFEEKNEIYKGLKNLEKYGAIYDETARKEIAKLWKQHAPSIGNDIASKFWAGKALSREQVVHLYNHIKTADKSTLDVVRIYSENAEFLFKEALDEASRKTLGDDMQYAKPMLVNFGNHMSVAFNFIVEKIEANIREKVNKSILGEDGKSNPLFQKFQLPQRIREDLMADPYKYRYEYNVITDEEYNILKALSPLVKTTRANTNISKSRIYQAAKVNNPYKGKLKYIGNDQKGNPQASILADEINAGATKALPTMAVSNGDAHVVSWLSESGFFSNNNVLSVFDGLNVGLNNNPQTISSQINEGASNANENSIIGGVLNKVLAIREVYDAVEKYMENNLSEEQEKIIAAYDNNMDSNEREIFKPRENVLHILAYDKIYMTDKRKQQGDSFVERFNNADDKSSVTFNEDKFALRSILNEYGILFPKKDLFLDIAKPTQKEARADGAIREYRPIDNKSSLAENIENYAARNIAYKTMISLSAQRVEQFGTGSCFDKSIGEGGFVKNGKDAIPFEEFAAEPFLIWFNTYQNKLIPQILKDIRNGKNIDFSKYKPNTDKIPSFPEFLNKYNEDRLNVLSDFENTRSEANQSLNDNRTFDLLAEEISLKDQRDLGIKALPKETQENIAYVEQASKPLPTQEEIQEQAQNSGDLKTFENIDGVYDISDIATASLQNKGEIEGLSKWEDIVTEVAEVGVLSGNKLMGNEEGVSLSKIEQKQFAGHVKGVIRNLPELIKRRGTKIIYSEDRDAINIAYAHLSKKQEPLVPESNKTGVYMHDQSTNTIIIYKPKGSKVNVNTVIVHEMIHAAIDNDMQHFRKLKINGKDRDENARLTKREQATKDLFDRGQELADFLMDPNTERMYEARAKDPRLTPEQRAYAEKLYNTVVHLKKDVIEPYIAQAEAMFKDEIIREAEKQYHFAQELMMAYLMTDSIDTYSHGVGVRALLNDAAKYTAERSMKADKTFDPRGKPAAGILNRIKEGFARGFMKLLGIDFRHKHPFSNWLNSLNNETIRGHEATVLNSLDYLSRTEIKDAPNRFDEYQQNSLFDERTVEMESSQNNYKPYIDNKEVARMASINKSMSEAINQNTETRASIRRKETFIDSSFEAAVRAGFKFATPLEASTFKQALGLAAVNKNMPKQDVSNIADLSEYVISELTRKGKITQEQLKYISDTSSLSNGVIPSYAPVLALAVANKDFRSLVYNLNPKKDETKKNDFKNIKNSFDAMLYKMGDKFYQMVAPDKKLRSEMPYIAYDAMVKVISDVDQIKPHRRYIMDSIDKANDFTKTVLEKSFDTGFSGLHKLPGRLKVPKIKFKDITAANIKKALVTGTDYHYHLFNELIKDMLGRTEGDNQIYTLLKQSKTFAGQYREQLKQVYRNKINGIFKRPLTSDEQKSLDRSLGQMNFDRVEVADVLNGIKYPNALNNHIKELEQAILLNDHGGEIIKNANNLVAYMHDGTLPSNGPLLRNAYAISRNFSGTAMSLNDSLYNTVSKYISLKYLETIPTEEKKVLNNLDRTELGNLLQYVKTIKDVSSEKRDSMNEFVRLNSWDGDLYRYKENENQIIVDKSSNAKELKELGWKQGRDIGGGYSYFSRTFDPTSTYSQGIMQIINETTGSFSNITGKTNNSRIAGQVSATTGIVTKLPIFDKYGNIIGYDIPVPKELENLDPYRHNLTESLVTEIGRRNEVEVAKVVNEALVNSLYNMWNKAKPEEKRTEFIDIEKEAKRDRVLNDTLERIPFQLRQQLHEKFNGKQIMVRKDLVADAFGERSASVGDLFTGKTRWGNVTQQCMRDSIKAILGKNAFEKAITAEKSLQEVMTSARRTIVVKSILVPAMNIAANFVQLTLNGMNPIEITRAIPRKIGEIENYIRLKKKQLDLRAEMDLRAGDPRAVESLNSRIKLIDSEIENLPSYPLLRRGEYTSIMDIAINTQDSDILRDSMSYIERQIYKMPESLIKNIARYGVISQDTPLYKGLQKSVQYGDYIAKAILYEHLTKNKGESESQAALKVADEFVDYDRVVGRNRQYFESIGALWFYNFMLRSVRSGFRLLKDNPLYLIAKLGTPLDAIEAIGDPMSDNVVGRVLSGKIRGFNFFDATKSITMLPAINLIN